MVGEGTLGRVVGRMIVGRRSVGTIAGRWACTPAMVVEGTRWGTQGGTRSAEAAVQRGWSLACWARVSASCRTGCYRTQR